MNIASSTYEISNCKKHTILVDTWLYLDINGTDTVPLQDDHNTTCIQQTNNITHNTMVLGLPHHHLRPSWEFDPCLHREPHEQKHVLSPACSLWMGEQPRSLQESPTRAGKPAWCSKSSAKLKTADLESTPCKSKSYRRMKTQH